jgi:hypothetical protein
VAEETVTRFFFDYTTEYRSLFDYHGEEFKRLEGASEFALAIAQNLTNSLTGDWAGWSVEVRNAEGKKFFSFPVDNAGLAA